MKKRNKLYLALHNTLFSQRWAALSAIPLLLSPLAAQAQDTTQKWDCGTDDNGNWQCVQKTVPGTHYVRPFHAESLKAPEDEGPDVRASRNLDWVDEENLSDEQKAELKPGCCGAYVEPKRDYPDADKDPEEAPLRLAASTSEVMANDVAKLQGGVQITQGYRQIRGDNALVDRENRTAEITGNVQMREPGVLLLGESAQVDLDSKEAFVENMTYVFHEEGVRGTAEQLHRKTSTYFVIDNATYTTCEPTSNAWLIASSKVKLNTEANVGTARNVTVKVKGVPVAYLPWMRFPLGDERTTGLLFPYFELSDDNGVDFAQPVYLNLAPNYDATITPRYVQERGAALEVEGRHLSSITETVVGGSFLADDDGGDDPDDLIRLYEGEDRWIAHVDHRGGFGKQWRTRIDYTDISDPDYFSDLDTATLQASSRTHLTQHAEVGYLWNNWDFSVSHLELESVSDDPTDDDYIVSPELAANGYYRLGNWTAQLNNEYASFDHDQELDRFGDPLPTGERLRLDYDLTWDQRWAWGFFKPGVGINYFSYDLDNTALGADDNPSATIPVFSIDSGIFLERNTTWIGNFIQTFEPRLYGLYVDFEDQSDFPEFDTTERTFSYGQLFTDNRFIGGDRIGDAQQISVGLTTRLISQESGREVFRASLAQAYYLDDREVAIRTTRAETLLADESAYAGELAFYLGNNWRFQADALYDETDGELDRGNVYLRYHNDATIFNMGYRYTRRGSIVDPRDNDLRLDQDIDQSDISSYLPLFGNWNLVARWNYDFTNNRELETFAGLEYDSCCWRISVLARRWIDRDDNLLVPEEDAEEDNGVFFQIQFKGLGGTGKRVDNILSDGIIGYDKNR